MARGLRFSVIMDKASKDAMQALLDFLSPSGVKKVLKIQSDAGKKYAENALREVRARLLAHTYPGAGASVSPATTAILEARRHYAASEKTGAFNPKNLYPTSKKLTRAPLLRNDDLLKAFKVIRVRGGWAVGIYAQKLTQNGGPMAKVAQLLNDGYSIRVTKDMENFFLAMRIAMQQKKAPKTIRQKGDAAKRRAFFRRHRASLGHAGTEGVIPNVKEGDMIKVPARPYLDQAMEALRDEGHPAWKDYYDFLVSRTYKLLKINSPPPAGNFSSAPMSSSAGMEAV